jgi:pSer/pThr/pTyr-binding forkhead associated (FHA) protein
LRERLDLRLTSQLFVPSNIFVCHSSLYQMQCKLQLIILPMDERRIPDKLDAADDYSVHNTALEWPGNDEIVPQELVETSRELLRPGQPTFRLVVLRSSILPNKQKIAVIDSYHEAQLGRDLQAEGSVTPRVRLKEMEVSKFHATVYWDGARKEWNVVDMGSKHGTFLLAGSVSPKAEDIGIRLSQAKAASIPRRLLHGDRLRIGSTMFAVHIHENQRPCQDCAVSQAVEIPLFPSPKKRRTLGTDEFDLESSRSSRVSMDERNPKKALTMLKSSLLANHEAETSSVVAGYTPIEYVDRAARRRLLFSSFRSDSPGISNPTVMVGTKDGDKIPTPLVNPSPKPGESQGAAPLPSSNMGYKLLLRQGWAPGAALGVQEDSSEKSGLIDPVEVKSTRNRAGLGSKLPPAETGAHSSYMTWKDREKFKRYIGNRL